MLLSFDIANFGSFAESGALTLTRPSLKTETPREDSSWIKETQRIAGIFGANASGKTTMLLAIRSLATAIAYPQDAVGLLYHPHKTNRRHLDKPTTYAISFVTAGTRYDYEIHAYAWGIGFEGLYAYPVGRRRVLFEIKRTSLGDSEVKFNRQIKWPSEVVDLPASTILLGTAFTINHKLLTPIARSIRLGSDIRSVFYSDSEQEERIQWLISQIVSSEHKWENMVNVITRMADLGIKEVAVRKQDVPEEVLNHVRSMLCAFSNDEIKELPKEIVDQLSRALVFTHDGGEDEDFELNLISESQGTRTWLATIGPVIDALIYGRVLLIDELELSLHPRLAFTILQLFKDDLYNQHGAQLIFTSHSSDLLGKMGSIELEPSEVWFTEKSGSGKSELYSLDEFDNRDDFNDQKRYLSGRYGAIPNIDLTEIHYALS